MPIKLPSFRPRRDAYPPDLWTKCPSCGEMLFNKQLDKVLRVCPSCGHHFRLSAETRLGLLVDHASFVEHDPGLESEDPLGFVDQKTYPDRIAAAQLATGMRDAAVWGTGLVDGRPVAICVMDFGFMGGSMGAVVGEKVTRAAEHALAERVPLVVVSASGGARMQEGTLSLMQLAKSVAALERLRAAGVPFVSILTDPTTGGVFASFAVLGDVNIAEPNALIGFAGARVSAGTIAQELPPGFQRSEFLFEHGFLDRVVHRSELRNELVGLLGFLMARPTGIPVAEDDEVIGLPNFRPFSFLSNLAERVLPSDPDAGNGHGAGEPVSPERTTRPRSRTSEINPSPVAARSGGAAAADPGLVATPSNGSATTDAPDASEAFDAGPDGAATPAEEPTAAPEEATHG
jgi:acetyl-CoA carboxylase carboxyl transferase subunit beta